MIKTNTRRDDHCGILVSYFGKDPNVKPFRSSGFLYAVSNDRTKGIVLTCAHNLVSKVKNFMNGQEILEYNDAHSA
jgi:hypothetical protein